MVDFTLYADESGAFQCPRQGAALEGAALGKRVVAALLLPGRPEDHRVPVDADLARRFGWWRIRHACECAPINVARILARTPCARVPPDLCETWEWLQRHHYELLRTWNPRLAKTVTKEAHRLQREGTLAAGAACRQFGGAAAICIEHDTQPEASRYPAMLSALVEWAVTWLVERGAGGAQLTVVPEAGASGAQDFALDAVLLARMAETAWLRRRPRAEGAAPRVIERIAWAPKGRWPASALADALAHQLGPRKNPFKTIAAQEARGWSLKAVRWMVRERMGEGCDLALVDAEEGSAQVRRVLLGEVPAGTAWDLLRTSLKQLGPGAMAGPLEDACERLRRWEELGL